jgi:hypothetical protein
MSLGDSLLDAARLGAVEKAEDTARRASGRELAAAAAQASTAAVFVSHTRRPSVSCANPSSVSVV